VSGKRLVRGWLPLVAVLISGGAVRPALAQDPAAIPQIQSGAYVRARLEPELTLSGRFVPVGDGRLGIRSDAGSTDTLRLSQVRELSVRERHTKAGAVIGGIVGLGAGVFIGYIATHLCDAAECDMVGPYLVAIPLFTAGGALTGTVLGTAFPKWKRVYP
jgi:hypothetical protein